MKPSTPSLPVDAILPDLLAQLTRHNAVVLQAPPGSGKTTRVPLFLRDADWLQGQRILMLEPRRLAATNAAGYMAGLLGEPVGATVGYSIRYQQKRSKQTRIEVVTEGLLTRRLQSDPELSGIGLVIFDEFHERSLNSDWALALCRDVQQGLRDDLRLLVMSATLDAEPVAALLGNCPVLTASGRAHPVDLHYLPQEPAQRLAETTAAAVRKALNETSGDLLVFLPGAGDIRRCQALLTDLEPGISLRPLYGGLPFQEQELAILPGPQRRVVLATNVAETSLTIEGIATVVDSGWEKRPRFDAARGMTTLERVRISRASADQRAGRAGRLGPGQCYRLWTEGIQGALLPFAPPEIRQADLTPLAFDLAQWGVADVATLSWLDPPPTGHLRGGQTLLQQLGAVTATGQLTGVGKQMAAYATHPRIARLLVAAVEQGCPGLGSDLVALLTERDSAVISGTVSLLDRVMALNRQDRSSGSVARAARYWRQKTHAKSEPAPEMETTAQLLALAFPDRIARRRSGAVERYLLRNGHGGRLGQQSGLRDAEWLVVVELVGQGGAEGEIRLAVPISSETVEQLFGNGLDWQREVTWDESAGRVVASEVRRLGAIVLQERPVKAKAEDTVPAFCGLVRRQGLELLNWSREARQLRARVQFLQQHCPDGDWPDWSTEMLLQGLEEWLAPWLNKVRRRDDLKRLDLEKALRAALPWPLPKELDRLAPERLEVPSGSKLRIDYTEGEQPVLAVKLQEMFGLAETPRLVAGRVPVQIHLLSPAGRPLAVTQDLKSFWNEVYPEVKKEMKGRYPKHPWPDDPWSAEATRWTKRKVR